MEGIMAVPIHLSGTTLEGGGQLLRLATCLASLTSTPIHITSIRGNRSGGGGLKAQHLASLSWLAEASNSHVQGRGLKSKEITLTPPWPPQTHLWETTTGGNISIKQSTPGSVTLILQAILPYILFSATTTSPITLTITGGTNVSNSPSCDYIEQVLIPMLTLIGIPPITSKIHSRGWSHGGTSLGSVTYTITPFAPSPTPKLPSFTLTTRGDITHIHATIIAPASYETAFTTLVHTILSHQPLHLALRHPSHPATQKTSSDTISISHTFTPSHNPKRIYLLLVSTSTTGIKLGHDWLYDRRVDVSAEVEPVVRSVVEKVADGLAREIRHGGCVDEWMRDQLVVFQVLAGGRCVVDGGRQWVRGPDDCVVRNGEKTDEEGRWEKLRPSLHARTAMWVANRILGVEFEGEDGACVGIGFSGCAERKVQEEQAEGTPAGDDDVDVEEITADMSRVKVKNRRA